MCRGHEIVSNLPRDSLTRSQFLSLASSKSTSLSLSGPWRWRGDAEARAVQRVTGGFRGQRFPRWIPLPETALVILLVRRVRRQSHLSGRRYPSFSPDGTASKWQSRTSGVAMTPSRNPTS
jgi:hypothetical protein